MYHIFFFYLIYRRLPLPAMKAIFRSFSWAMRFKGTSSDREPCPLISTDKQFTSHHLLLRPTRYARLVLGATADILSMFDQY